MSSNRNDKGKFGPLGLIAIFVIFLAIILSASIMGVFKGNEPYQQLIAAMLSVAATGVITALLLFFQRKQQEELNEKQRSFQEETNRQQRAYQEKLTSEQRTFEAEQKEKEKIRLQETKVFEEKLKIYKEFLQKLFDVVKDMKIEKEEEIMLEFQVASIAMHTNSDSIVKISDKVASIIVSIKEGMDNGEERLRKLFEIADIFYFELYGKENPVDDNVRNTTIGNFLSISNNNIKVYDKIRIIKNLIKNTGTIQSISNDNTLVHEYFTDYDEHNCAFVKSDNRIFVSLEPVDNKYLDLKVYSRLNNEIQSQQIAKGIGEVFESPTNHLYKRIQMATSNEEIVTIMRDLLAKVKAYRDKEFSLK